MRHSRRTRCRSCRLRRCVRAWSWSTRTGAFDVVTSVERVRLDAHGLRPRRRADAQLRRRTGSSLTTRSTSSAGRTTGTSCGSRRSSPRRRSSCSTRTTGRRSASSTPPTRSSPTTRPAGPSTCGPSRSAASSSPDTTPRTSTTRPASSSTRCTGSSTPRACATATSRSSTGPTRRAACVEEALVRAGLPYRVVGGMKFYDRREVKDALAYLRALVNPDDEVSWKRIVNAPKRGVGDTSVRKVEAYAQGAGLTFRDALRDAPRPGVTGKALGGIRDLLELMAEFERRRRARRRGRRSRRCSTAPATSPSSRPSARSRRRAASRTCSELVGVCQRVRRGARRRRPRRASPASPIVGDDASSGEAPPRASRRVQAFLEASRSSPTSTRRGPASRARSTLMTLHSAKGLEFPVVFLTGLEDGIFPHMRSLGDPEELEEERRLCYVGITRARGAPLPLPRVEPHAVRRHRLLPAEPLPRRDPRGARAHARGAAPAARPRRAPRRHRRRRRPVAATRRSRATASRAAGARGAESDRPQDRRRRRATRSSAKA